MKRLSRQKERARIRRIRRNNAKRNLIRRELIFRKFPTEWKHKKPEKPQRKSFFIDNLEQIIALEQYQKERIKNLLFKTF